jgi:hypothetical protein
MVIGAIVGAVVGAATSVVSQAVAATCCDMGQVAQQAVVGAMSGAISGLAGPEAGYLVHVAVGAAAGAVQQVGLNLVTGKPLGDGVLMATVVGGLSGGVGKFASEQLVGRAASAATGAATDAADSAEQDAASAAEGAACGLSFSADTQVATPSGERPISSLQVGDAVDAYDAATGRASVQTVEQVFVNHDSDLVDVTLRTQTASDQAAGTVVGADDVPTRLELRAAHQHGAAR